MMSEIVEIPEGNHSINPYIVVKNSPNAREYYKKASGAGAEERFGMQSPDSKNIMHADLKISDSIFMLTEDSAEMKCHSPESIGGIPVSLYVYVNDGDTIFNQAVSARSTLWIQFLINSMEIVPVN